MKDLKAFNLTLLGKWLWRVGSNTQGLWREVIESRYGVLSRNIVRSGKKQSKWWRDIQEIEKKLR